MRLLAARLLRCSKRGNRRNKIKPPHKTPRASAVNSMPVIKVINIEAPFNSVDGSTYNTQSSHDLCRDIYDKPQFHSR